MTSLPAGGPPHAIPDSEGNNLALKRRRITRACDRCHKGGIKCAPSPDPSTCAPCRSFGNLCTYDRPIKRRGPASKKVKETDESPTLASISGNGNDGLGMNGGMIDPALIGAVVGQIDFEREDDEWRADHVASAAMINQLVEGYHRICYPM